MIVISHNALRPLVASHLKQKKTCKTTRWAEITRTRVLIWLIFTSTWIDRRVSYVRATTDVTRAARPQSIAAAWHVINSNTIFFAEFPNKVRFQGVFMMNRERTQANNAGGWVDWEEQTHTHICTYTHYLVLKASDGPVPLMSDNRSQVHFLSPPKVTREQLGQ